MKDNALKYTCLFGGGAIRGAAYVGAVKALEEIGINPQNLGGSSVGSIVAALLAIGYNAGDLKEIFLAVNFDLFRDFQIGLGPKFALSKGEVFLDWIRELIEKKYYGDKYKKGENKPVTFKDLDKNLIIITTDLSNFGCKEFSKFETPDFEIATAVRISSTMPGLMKPYEFNSNTLLVDGDLQKSMPMWKLSKHLLNDDERILEFRLEGETYGANKNALDYFNTVYTCITAMCTSFISEAYGKRDKFDYIVLNTGDVLVVDFNCPKEKREELMDSGYKQTMDYFKKILPKKKSNLLEHYYIINKYLKQSQKLINNKKYAKAKNMLSELFVHICDFKDTIDRKIIRDIRNFYKHYTKSIKYPALFGKTILKNEDELGRTLNKLVSNTSEKIYETESYIVKHPI